MLRGGRESLRLEQAQPGTDVDGRWSTVDGGWQIGWGCAAPAYRASIAPCFARVTLTLTDAVVEVAGHKIGTGAYTICAQTAADRLGLPVDRIKVMMGDSGLPPAPVAGGSNNAASISNAVALGCAMVRGQIATAATANPKSPFNGRAPATLTLVNGTLRDADGLVAPLANALARLGGAVKVLAGNEPHSLKPGSLAGARNAQLTLGGGFADPKKLKAAFGAKFVEGCVHRLPREVRVSRIVRAFAAGTIMNPIIARSQLMGGMIRGISSALL